MRLTIKKILYLSAIFFIITKIAITAAIFLYPKIISDENMDVNARELIGLTNQYRQEHGLSALSPNARLAQAAVNKARDLLAKQYFNHTSPEGKNFSDWIKEVNYQYFYVGENLAIDFDNNQEVFEAWLNSPTHKDNIVKPQYSEIGLAALKGKYKNRPTTMVVQLFGTRILGANESADSQPAPIKNLVDNYFYQQNFWQKITSLENLEKLNGLNNYLLIILVGLALISYTPQRKKNQINIKQPIINRYQAKMFRE
ncbi:CAP domain-containing protein [Candidatus Falkowbacteria bacterium]|nr:CAP domain-containing protein [Candidatus Falkowbacteria bacterium]